MALLAKQGSFASRSTTGNFSITGVGFQPKVLIVYSARMNGLANSTTAGSWFLGFATSPTAQVCSGGGVDSQTNQFASNANLIFTNAFNASLVSFDADGFTLNTYLSTPTPFTIHYLSLGGDDIINAKAGTFLPSGSLGNQTIAGIGFQPNTLVSLPSRAGMDGDVYQVTSWYQSLGVAIGSSASEQWVENTGWEDRNSNRLRAAQQAGYAVRSVAHDGTVYGRAALSGFTADGFTLNWSTAGISSWRHHYLALNVAHRAVGAFNQAPTTGTQAVTGLGLTPKALLFSSFGAAATTSTITSAELMTGLTDGTGQVSSSMSMSSGDTTPNARQETAKALVAVDLYLNSVVARASLASLDSDGFTLSWDTNDGVQRQIMYLALGEATVTTVDGGTFSLTAASTTDATGNALYTTATSSAAGSVTAIDGSALFTSAMTSDELSTVTIDGVRLIDSSLIDVSTLTTVADIPPAVLFGGSYTLAPASTIAITPNAFVGSAVTVNAASGTAVNLAYIAGGKVPFGQGYMFPVILERDTVFAGTAIRTGTATIATMSAMMFAVDIVPRFDLVSQSAFTVSPTAWFVGVATSTPQMAFDAHNVRVRTGSASASIASGTAIDVIAIRTASVPATGTATITVTPLRLIFGTTQIDGSAQITADAMRFVGQRFTPNGSVGVLVHPNATFGARLATGAQARTALFSIRVRTSDTTVNGAATLTATPIRLAGMLCLINGQLVIALDPTMQASGAFALTSGTNLLITPTATYLTGAAIAGQTSTAVAPTPIILLRTPHLHSLVGQQIAPQQRAGIAGEQQHGVRPSFITGPHGT